MAKGNIALGKFRGKVGGQVLRVDAGIGQIISEYNPHPSNPRTVAQTTQRAKMNLAGQLSKFTPREVIAGFDANNRKARSMFVGSLLKIADFEPVTGMAKIPFNNVKLNEKASIGFKASAEITEETTNLVVTLTDNTAEGNYAGVLVMAYISGESKTIGSRSYTVPAGTTSLTIDLAPFVHVDGNEVNVQLYIIPIGKVEGAGALTFEQLFPGQGWSARVVTSQVYRDAYHGSQYVGSYYIA